MTLYNSVNVKLSNSQLSKLKSAIKNATEVALSSSITGDSKDATNFPHKQLQHDRQVLKLWKALTNYLKLNCLK